MYLFQDGDTSATFKKTFDKINQEIEGLSNETICGTDLEDLADYYVSKNQIEEIEIFKDNITKDISETKIKKHNPFYRGGNDPYELEFHIRDGYKATFTIPFDGMEDLLTLRPSSYYMSRFEIDSLISPTESEYGKILISFDFDKKELQESENSNKLVQMRFNQEIKTYFEMIEWVNEEVRNYNDNLPTKIRQCLTERLQRANDYLQIRERLELSLKLNDKAPNTKPILLKKTRKPKEVNFPSKKKSEKEYEISNADYDNIKNIIMLACTSMEKTAHTFKKLLEEELRDVILSHLNTHYQGTASGETFNKIGKTDIYIPFENKSAYIAECKIWHGNKKFLEAIDQLCGYTTWRDTKTSLIIFNKENKDFNTLLESIDLSLKELKRCKDIIRVGQNEWQGTFTKEVDSNDVLTVNITIYDLYVKEYTKENSNEETHG